MALIVRAAAATELAGLASIELSGEAMFAELGIVFPSGPATVEVAIAHGAEIFVAGDPPGELRVYRWVTGSESRRRVGQRAGSSSTLTAPVRRESFSVSTASSQRSSGKRCVMTGVRSRPSPTKSK